MQTIRTFFNATEAGLTESVLQAAGIHAVLAEDNAFTMGPQYVPWGIRLQVAESDADEAERVLSCHEEFKPLADDFVPPDEPSEESAAPSQQALDAFDAFVRGGMWAVFLLGVFVVVSLMNGVATHADPGRFLLAFFLGGILGVAVPGILRKRRRDESGKEGEDSSETPGDEK